MRVGVGRTCSVLAGREERFQIGVIAAIKYLAKRIRLHAPSDGASARAHHIEQDEEEARVRHHNDSSVGALEQPPETKASETECSRQLEVCCKADVGSTDDER